MNILIEDAVRSVLPPLIRDLLLGMFEQLLGNASRLTQRQPHQTRRQQSEDGNMAQPTLIPLRDLAPILGLKYQTLKNKLHQGTLGFKTKKVGRTPMVHRAVFDAYLDSIADQGLPDQLEKRTPTNQENPAVAKRKATSEGQIIGTCTDLPSKDDLGNKKPSIARRWKEIRDRPENVAYRQKKQLRKQTLRKEGLARRTKPASDPADAHDRKTHWTHDPIHPAYIKRQKRMSRKNRR